MPLSDTIPEYPVSPSRRDIDIHYPELFSKRHSLQTLEFPHNYRREQKRDLRKNRNKTRYRTQPVTFDEIQEVDEENIEPNPDCGDTQGPTGTAMSPSDLRRDFMEFSKSLQESVNRKVSGSKQPNQDEVKRLVVSNIDNQNT